MYRFFSALTLSAAVASFAFGQSPPTIDELIELERPVQVQISPDGQTVVYTVEAADWEEDRYVRHLVLAQGETRFRLTRGQGSSHAPRFSPDGKSLFFLSDRSGTSQIYRMALAGGEAEPLTEREDGVSRYEVSPNGEWLAFSALEEKSPTLKERQERYGEFTWVDEDPRMTRLFRFDLESGVTEPLTSLTLSKSDADFTVDDFAISPKGTQIVFSARPIPDPSARLESDLYSLRLDETSPSPNKLVSWDGTDSSPRFSPDGSHVAFVTSGGVASYYLNREIAVVAADASEDETPILLTKDFDESPQLVAWTDQGIFFHATQKTERHLFRLPLSTLSAERSLPSVERIGNADLPILRGCSLSKDGDRVACLGESFDRFGEVYLANTQGFDPERLTDFDDQLSGMSLSTREVIRWSSEDGARIEGVLMKPKDFDPSRKYPLLFKIHGGPTGVDTQQKLTSSDLRYYPLEHFVARGALVLMVNYRGSAGYGEAFRSLNVRRLGIGDEWDIVSGLDHLIELGFIDASRVGTMGWSQGGYISAFLATKNERFRAASVGAGISDWMTYYVNTDIHPFTRQYLKDTPWNDPDTYDATSPIHYIRDANTPTLIQHGENDKRVPLPNAFELYQGLRDQGVPVRLSIFKGFGHGITKPKSNRAVMEQNRDWFERWIFSDPAASQ